MHRVLLALLVYLRDSLLVQVVVQRLLALKLLDVPDGLGPMRLLELFFTLLLVLELFFHTHL